MNLKIRIIFLFGLLSFCNAAAAITIPYGKNGKIDYNLKTGTFTVVAQNASVLINAYSQVNIAGKLLRSTDYQLITYSIKTVKDTFGKVHTITMQKKGLPTLKQIFYTSNKQNYFLLALEVDGPALSTNLIEPIVAQLVPNAYTHSLFVPFDNDTFISYDAKPIGKNFNNASAEVGVVYSNPVRHGLVVGSVTHGIWKTGVLTKQNATGEMEITAQCGYTDPAVTRDQIPHGTCTGNKLSSAKIFVAYQNDWRQAMETYAKVNRISEPPIIKQFTTATPLGWNSWGVMQERINENNIKEVVDFFADHLPVFRSEGACYIDLDSYWDNLINGGLAGDFSKLKKFADYVKTKGLKPGIYWAPFTDWGYKAGANRKAEGSNYQFGDLWTKVGANYHDLDGARALDPTHPGTQARIKLVIEKLKACGFEMIKIDFLGHAAIESSHFYDPKVTTGMQAYAIGMEYLVKQLDNRMLIYAAISPSLASGRYVHVRRIACDAFKSINDTKYTLNSVTNGWWQTHLYDYIDADHVVFGSESEAVNTARLLSAIVTGTLITGDDFSTNGPWRARATTLLQNKDLLAVIKDGKSFVPVEGDQGKSASPIFIKRNGDQTYLAFFNYENEVKKIPINFSRLGLTLNKQVTAQNLLSKEKITFSNSSEIMLQANQAVIFKISQN
jgi:alpha-galactosidase